MINPLVIFTTNIGKQVFLKPGLTPRKGDPVILIKDVNGKYINIGVCKPSIGDEVIFFKTLTGQQVAMANIKPIVTASPPPDNVLYGSQTITLTMNEAGTIYYTTDGSDPTDPAHGIIYTNPISIPTGNTTLKFYGIDVYGIKSLVWTDVYDINAAIGSNPWQTAICTICNGANPIMGNPPKGYAGYITGMGWSGGGCYSITPPLWQQYPFSWLNYSPVTGNTGVLEAYNDSGGTTPGITDIRDDYGVDYDPLSGFSKECCDGTSTADSCDSHGGPGCTYRLTPFTGSNATINEIGASEAQYPDPYPQVCSDVSCFNTTTGGDCWADAAWLYNTLSAAGFQARIMGYVDGGSGVGYRHTWVQVYLLGLWQTWNYQGFYSHHFGDVGGGTPFVLIGPGNAPADISQTGY
jgi:hypothetical protein